MIERDCKKDELRQRALGGDPNLLEDLFNYCRDDLMVFLRQRCRDHHDAQDAMQDTFVAAAQYLSGYRGDAQLKTWLYRLAASACTRMRRGQKNNPGIHEALDETALPRPATSPHALDLAIDARLRPLKRAIEQLKPMDRKVLLLRDGEGMSTREVAAALKLSEASVKSRLHRTRQSVKEALEASSVL